jgi:hypothetical protein
MNDAIQQYYKEKPRRLTSDSPHIIKATGMMVNLQEEASLPFKTKIKKRQIRGTWKCKDGRPRTKVHFPNATIGHSTLP